MQSNRRYQKLPVHIVEYHNEALTYIYRGIGSKHLPFKDLAVVHFDSHPDLGIPACLKADDIFSKEKIFELLGIESWLLPAVYAGHINTIIWCKPVWSNQISDGEYQFYVGRDPSCNEIRVSSRHPYFTSDCLFIEEDVMNDKNLLTLHVVTIDESTVDRSVTSLLAEGQTYVLDIDLDFFSTRNPFRNMFTEEDLAILTELYFFRLPQSNETESIASCQEARSKQLKELRAWISDVKDGKDSSEDKRFLSLKRILKTYEASLERSIDEEDIDVFHGAGCSTDEPGLPHHVSSDEEIDSLMTALSKLLHRSAHPPAFVSMARSTVDGYCPTEQVQHIQSKTMELLETLYSPIEFFHDYD